MTGRRNAVRTVVRRTVATAWLALLVPLGGVGLAVVVGGSDENLTSTDPVVTWGFLGGAAIGLALWAIGVSALSGQAPIWELLAGWPIAVAVFLAVGLGLGRGGAGAGLAAIAAVAWWWMRWYRTVEQSV